MASSSSQHAAAVLNTVGQPLKIEILPTPTPGPEEVLIEVSSIALNPIDVYQRDMGFMLKASPAVVGSDIAGIIISVGTSVSEGTFQKGTRVAAFAQTFFVGGEPDYGAFQKFVLVPAANVCPLPEEISFNDGALLPMSVVTALSGWYVLDLPFDTKISSADKKAMLVWGGSSSVGTGAVQSAKLMGYTVYATASKKNHEYVNSLGASKVFDYNDSDVVQRIVKAAKEDGLALTTAYISASGALRSTLDVLKEFKDAGEVKVATAISLQQESGEEEGIEIKFVAAPLEEEPKKKLFSQIMNMWLKEKLESGQYKPSPAIEVFPGGLDGINDALDKLKSGAMSAGKLVVEI